ncbi:uncharacterized protein MEPE_06766 [Melanopsichium pennsylvanicum]|uniref:Uncharacterized protein n=2 Tax=Melanopsichium pennsylvanicum TaxID=63383 RepID=A0AAJ4XSF4_9BASI|nr:hypothetical protein BN887_04686 [Melanopsichium pennsylvanicum 4]SNX88055.1 uncharacterized protein MEPE_06766 [Melanopsichium pennsylvanicum]
MSTSQEQQSRAALALPLRAVPAGIQSTSTSSLSTPIASSGSSQHSTQNVLPSYSEVSSTSLRVEAPQWPSSQASSSSHTIAPGSDSFFDIAPRSDSTSFQVGYLGLKGFQAWLKGDVLVKLDAETKSKGRYTRCVVQLQAKEQAINSYSQSEPRPDNTESASACSSRNDVIELFSHTLVLWDADKESTTSNSSLSTMPSTMPFSFPLTQDLPHCVHLRDSSLTYTLTAQLFSEDSNKLPHAVKEVPVHLVRYTRPGPLNEIELAEIDGASLPNEVYTLEPHNWIKKEPTLVYAHINRTIFRRAEPIDIRVRIPPPDQTSVSEKGLKLRAVEADFVRLIHTKRVNGAAGDRGDASVVEAIANEPNVYEALLAHSGKLCRFHSQRPVLLRLTLHPPFDRTNMPHPHPDHDALASGPVFGRGGGGGCESISQETLMHKVSFEVRIKIGIQGGRGEGRDIICRRSVKILPGAAGALEDLTADLQNGALSALSEKERLKRSEKARMLAEDESAVASGSQTTSDANDLLNFGMDDEYDGYEDVGHGLDDYIDAANSSSAAGSSAHATDHAERLEQLRQFLQASEASAHDDRPPPTLLESRNDLQVEVQVEGVGLAMPRLAYRHPADHFPAGGVMSDGSFLPPPPIDAAHRASRDGPSAYAMLDMGSNEGLGLASDENDPPPPLSPLSQSVTQGRTEHGVVSGSGSRGLQNTDAFASIDDRRRDVEQGEEYPLLPPHSPPQTYPTYLDLDAPSSLTASMQHEDEAHPSYEAVVSGGVDLLQSNLGGTQQSRGGSGHHEPPPYADGSGQADPVPSFDQAVRQQSSSDGISVPRSVMHSSSSQPQIRQREARQMPVPSSHQISGVQNADHHPPAYGTSPHPPSYDA